LWIFFSFPYVFQEVIGPVEILFLTFLDIFFDTICYFCYFLFVFHI
jgi:hypothetical protein